MANSRLGAKKSPGFNTSWPGVEDAASVPANNLRSGRFSPSATCRHRGEPPPGFQSISTGPAAQALPLRKSPDFNGRQTPSGRRVGLMNNECVTVPRLPAKEPRIAIWTTVQFSPF